MRATGLLRRNRLEFAWGVFAGANLAAMELWPRWETVPFHFVWVSLTLLFGVRTWPASLTYFILAVVSFCTGVRSSPMCCRTRRSGRSSSRCP